MCGITGPSNLQKIRHTTVEQVNGDGERCGISLRKILKIHVSY
jgi:hypothetical protein